MAFIRRPDERLDTVLSELEVQHIVFRETLNTEAMNPSSLAPSSAAAAAAASACPIAATAPSWMFLHLTIMIGSNTPCALCR